MEDALDGIQDAPTLSTNVGNTQHLSPTKTGVGGDGGQFASDGVGDGNMRRLESLRELLSVALDRRPDLPLGLCVKSEHTPCMKYHFQKWIQSVGCEMEKVPCLQQLFQSAQAVYMVVC